MSSAQLSLAQAPDGGLVVQFAGPWLLRSERPSPHELESALDPARVRREIVALGVAPFFSTVVCGGETRERKPHPEPLLVALDRLGVAPGESAYVGDSPEDVMMARAAGAIAIGIPGGFPNRSALERAAPHVFAADLESALSALFG